MSEHRPPRITVVTSGKGGVGKTTTSAALAAAFALRGQRTVAVDFDVGLNNLDIVTGCSRRVRATFIDVMQGRASLEDALIRDERSGNLWILPTSGTHDKEVLTKQGVAKVLHLLSSSGQFDRIICDSPAGMDNGSLLAMYFADEAIVVANPEISSVRDADRIITFIGTRSRRKEMASTMQMDPVRGYLLVTRYNPNLAKRRHSLTIQQMLDLMSIPLIGIVPECSHVLMASGSGVPVTFDRQSDAGSAYLEVAGRLLGDRTPITIPTRKNLSLFDRLLRRAA